MTSHRLVNLTEGFKDVAVLVHLLIADDRQFVVVLPQHLHDRLIKIENVLAETYFSQEQMTVFRQHVMNQMRECNPLEEHVIRSLQSYVLMLVSDMQVHPQSFYDLVNIIRVHEEIFPAWHASATAKLYAPVFFVNKKKSRGYWF